MHADELRACTHKTLSLMITKLSQGRRNNGLNLRAPSNEPFVFCRDIKKQLDFNTDMLTKLITNMNVVRHGSFDQIDTEGTHEVAPQIDSSVGHG